MSGFGLHLVTDFVSDARGRLVRTLGPVHEAIVDGQSRSVRTATWNLHLDAAHETRTALGYRDVAAGAYAIVNPVSIVKRNERGNVLEEIRAVRATTAGEPTASETFARTDYVAWTVYEYTDCCRLLAVLVYHDIPATGEGLPWTNYACTTYGYDAVRRRNKTVTPGGTITRVVFDARGDVVQTWIGTNDSGATDVDPTGDGASGNTMVLVSEREYDDGLLTEQVLDPSDTEFRQTFYAYDWRHRLVDTTGEEGFFEKRSYDNLGRVTKTERYDGSAAGQLLARSHTFYDYRGRVYRTVQHEVDPATGVIGASLADDVWYDQAGNITKRQPEGVMTQIEFSYDGLGRVTTETDPRSAVTAFAYDAAGNRTSLTDAEDNATTWDYDPVGKVVAETNELNERHPYVRVRHRRKSGETDRPQRPGDRVRLRRCRTDG